MHEYTALCIFQNLIYTVGNGIVQKIRHIKKAFRGRYHLQAKYHRIIFVRKLRYISDRHCRQKIKISDRPKRPDTQVFIIKTLFFELETLLYPPAHEIHLADCDTYPLIIGHILKIARQAVHRFYQRYFFMVLVPKRVDDKNQISNNP